MADTPVSAPAAPAATPAAPAPAPAATPAPAPAPAAPAPAPVAPAAAGTPPAGTPSPQPAAPPPPPSARPTWLPETHWDANLNAINLEALQKDFESKAALAARKPEDIKLPAKLPDDIKLPQGATWKLNDKDPYVGMLRQIAAEEGLPQSAVDKFVVADARIKLANYQADQARMAAENAKLGEHGTARKDAIVNFLGASGLEPDERVAAANWMTDEVSVRAIEKLITKMIGGVAPNSSGSPAPSVEQKPERSLAQRMYPNMNSSVAPQQKAG